MRLLLIAGIIAVVAWTLWRGVHERRQRWLQRLALPGSWRGYQDGVEYCLELRGDIRGGQYREVEHGPQGERTERGDWRVVGHNLEFRADSGATSSCELRLFETGRIGLHGPGRERRIYIRESDNIVPLPRRKG